MRIPWIEGEREEGPALRAALLPMAALSWVYGGGARLHRALYDRGLRRQTRLGCRVLSVGNLGVGGAGKTPTTATLARELRRRGHRVAIASRGYRRDVREPVVVVSDGRRVLARAAESGDEPLLLAAHAPGVPVLVGARRAAVGQRAIASFGAEVLILDDGFQHHALERDLDLVVLDGHFGLGNARLLPRGPLREPLSALRRAHALGVIDGPLSEADERRVARFAAGARRFEARRAPRGLRPLEGGDLEDLTGLAGQEVGLLSGIARPDSLRRSVTALGACVVAERRFRDHHRYRPADLEGLSRAAPCWVTTEKDAIKLNPAWAGSARVHSLVIELEFDAPDFVDWLSTRLRG
ncbi:MAG: tetraacyldisaccharide 4'-kinase [Myxococcota bacterium]